MHLRLVLGEGCGGGGGGGDYMLWLMSGFMGIHASKACVGEGCGRCGQYRGLVHGW